MTVKKVVEGTDGEFEFAATLLNGSNKIAGYDLGGPSEEGSGSDESDSGSGSDSGKTEGSLVTNKDGQVTFRLSDGQTRVLTVPIGARLKVEEAFYETYETTVAGDGEEETSGLSYTAVIVNPITITFKNSEIVVAPTGLYTDKQPFGVMLLFGMLLGVLALIVRLRKKEV